MQKRDRLANFLFTAGFGTKGVIYILIGAFAVLSVISAARSVDGPKGVLKWLGNQPFGQFLVGAVGVGLVCYALWRIYAAAADVRASSDDKEDAVKRVGWFVSGLSHGLLAFFVFKLLTGGGQTSGDGKKQDAIQWLLAQSWGQWAVGAIGLIMLGVGGYQLYRAITNAHMKNIDKHRLKPERVKYFRRMGEVGLTARFLVFGIIAFFLGKAAVMQDADKFKGVGEAIGGLRDWPFGSALLTLVGLGMVAYGAFMIVRANYERVTLSD